ncbi:MAG: sulfite exporter TauE/SafE family protein [Clostridiales bacterium]|nr:sulfite exporter TauE/SafE family protein [Candidatus Apopatousia equi]
MEKLSNKRIIITGLVGGLFVGFLNGFFGGGGGMIVVPLLNFLLKLDERKSHATAIFVILPLSIVSSVIYILKGSIDWLQLLYSSIGFLVGGVVGALLLKKMNNKVLKIIFSLIMIAAGIKMFF